MFEESKDREFLIDQNLRISIKKTRSVVEAKNIILDFNNKNSASSDQHPQVKQQRSPEKLCVLLS